MSKHSPQDMKTILITGASSGIGEALAHYYAASGHNIIITGRNEERLNAVASACETKGVGDVVAKIVDVTDERKMTHWLNNILQLDKVDIVIANAGISGGTSGLDPKDIFDQSRAIFDVNVMGVINTISPVYKEMQKRGSGHIVLVSSLASYSIWTGAPAYATSKTTVRYFGESLRPFLKSQNIDLSVICPGFVKSRMTDKNDYKMPLKISAEKAAQIIARGLEKKQKIIAFPLRLYWFVRLIGCLPNWLISLITEKLPSKRGL